MLNTSKLASKVYLKTQSILENKMKGEIKYENDQSDYQT